jgi:hypothetical protein
MHPSNSTIVLLVVLLAVLNGKAIVEYVLWLRFKIRTFFKQLENERKDNTNSRSRELQRK